ncbi:PQQ-dependent sugar dehydrogenase [Flexivirga sp. ID2601S]|uniref:PQQ-dependent sugar dehydrogenase n=1 Tax=Flexivirga aerilata TaxID=1656889 RepID=A0A849AHC7_9MICO|nr:PQQ-dependent sugar dehydrogenase [Flexivirga aerilata]NNG38681.1 PQQ-dependent sugar dehydrogenase [Flexivirga aerilata]
MPQPYAAGPARPTRRAALVAGGLALAGLGACSSDRAATPQPAGSGVAAPTGSASGGVPSSVAGDVPGGAVTDVVTGLRAPWSVVWTGGAALLGQRDDARILQLADGRTREVLTVPGVAHGGEGGLLGLAVQGAWLTVYYTGDDQANRVVRYRISRSGSQVRLSGRQVVLDGLPAAGIHNGGRIAFGPDRMLYVAVGDTSDQQAAQDRSSPAGKILRMTPVGGVPGDNPFAGSRVWSLGHRNVQGMAWAPDGTMFAAEFGANTWDELNIIRRGANYGWPVHEGRAGDSRYVDPVQQWSTSEASPSGIAITGGTIYVACLGGRRLRAVPVSAPGTGREYFVGRYGRLRDVAIAPDGALWILTNNTDGRGAPNPGDDRILRVAPSALR